MVTAVRKEVIGNQICTQSYAQTEVEDRLVTLSHQLKVPLLEASETDGFIERHSLPTLVQDKYARTLVVCVEYARSLSDSVEAASISVYKPPVEVSQEEPGLEAELIASVVYKTGPMKDLLMITSSGGGSSVADFSAGTHGTIQGLGAMQDYFKGNFDFSRRN